MTGSKQIIVDELANLALVASIDDDEAQAIFARAAEAPPDPINGRATAELSASKNASVAFPLRAFETIRLETERHNYLVKGLLANTGLAVIWGPPKCGKSFWAADLGIHIALGWNYRGHRVQQATVIYVALEGRDGFPARVEAFRRHHGVDNAPFYLLPTSLDLVAESGQLIAAIKAQLGKNLPGALFLDTLNRSLVGSESKDEDMARFLAAAEKVAQELSCAVLIVHHCGIDASRPRGHTSLSGAVEVQLAVKRGGAGEVIATVELAKDFPEGTEIFSRLEPADVGIDPDGDKITSMVVVPAEASAVTRKLSDRQRLALDALAECAANVGKAAPSGLELPARTIVAPSPHGAKSFTYAACSTARPKTRARSSSACANSCKRAALLACTMSLYGKRNSCARAMSALCQTRKKIWQTSVHHPEYPHRFGHEGGHETFGAIDRRFCAGRWDSGRVWSQCATAAAARTRLSPTRVAEHLFAWHGHAGRGTEAT